MGMRVSAAGRTVVHSAGREQWELGSVRRGDAAESGGSGLCM